MADMVGSCGPWYVRCTLRKPLGPLRAQMAKTFMALTRFPGVVGTPDRNTEKSVGIEGIVHQSPGLRVLLKGGEEVDQREFDPLGQRGEGRNHIGADGVLPSRGLQKPAPAVGRRIRGIDLALG